MEQSFINLTNHPSKLWDRKQREEAEKYGEIVDIPFPNVEPGWSRESVAALSEKMVSRIMQKHPKAVLCQGEFCLAYQIVRDLQEKGVLVVAACSKRMVKEDGNQKLVTFKFEQFREY